MSMARLQFVHNVFALTDTESNATTVRLADEAYFVVDADGNVTSFGDAHSIDRVAGNVITRWMFRLNPDLYGEQARSFVEGWLERVQPDWSDPTPDYHALPAIEAEIVDILNEVGPTLNTREGWAEAFSLCGGVSSTLRNGMMDASTPSPDGLPETTDGATVLAALRNLVERGDVMMKETRRKSNYWISVQAD
jgi:hypothetical protein